MAKKPTKNVAKVDYNFDDFKKSQGIKKTIGDKPLSWIPLSKAWHDAIKLPGFARGYVNSVRGYSNTGKSTAFYEAIAGAQKIGDLPVIFETEGNFQWKHAKDCGMKFEELVDEETGEISYIKDGEFVLYSTREELHEKLNKDLN